MQAASIMGFIIFGSGVARFPMGALADRIEPRRIISAALFVMMFSLIGLWKAPSMGFLLFVGPCFGFSYGTLLVMQPSIIGEIATEAGVGAVLLSHRMNRSLGDENQTLQAVRRGYAGDISFSEPLQRVELLPPLSGTAFSR